MKLIGVLPLIIGFTLESKKLWLTMEMTSKCSLGTICWAKSRSYRNSRAVLAALHDPGPKTKGANAENWNTVRQWRESNTQHNGQRVTWPLLRCRTLSLYRNNLTRNGDHDQRQSYKHQQTTMTAHAWTKLQAIRVTRQMSVDTRWIRPQNTKIYKVSFLEY